MNKKTTNLSAQKQAEFRLTSFPKNRSKYLTLVSVYQCSGSASLSFLCINTPITVKGLRRGLPRWCQWNYLREVESGRYRITNKGVAFIKKLHTIIPGAVKRWNKELELWRAIPKEHLKNANGIWLPHRDIIKYTEALKFHRQGSPRPGAGRPMTEKGRQRLVAAAQKKQALKPLIEHQRKIAELAELRNRVKCPKCGGNVTPLGMEDGNHRWACFACMISFVTRNVPRTQA